LSIRKRSQASTVTLCPERDLEPLFPCGFFVGCRLLVGPLDLGEGAVFIVEPLELGKAGSPLEVGEDAGLPLELEEAGFLVGPLELGKYAG
jgi:hypothetical protein